MLTSRCAQRSCQTKPMPLTLKAKAQTIFINRFFSPTFGGVGEALNFKKMQTQKMSLASIKGKLSRAEMKNIMAGSGSGNYLCWLTTSGPNYSNPTTTGYLYSANACTGASSAANSTCVALIGTPGNGVYHCGYNCGC